MNAPQPTHRARVVFVALAVTGVLTLVAACSGPTNGDAITTAVGRAAPGKASVGSPIAGRSSGGSAGGSAGSSPNGTAGSSADRSVGGPATGGTGAVVLPGPKLIRTASVSLTSPDIATALAKINALVTAARGQVSSEDTSTNFRGRPVSSQLVVLVPEATFATSLNRIATFARLVQITQSSQDVTGQVADVNSRVRSANVSIRRLRQLFAQATRLGDIIALESDLAQRETALEALQARQRALAQETSMSTISIFLQRSPRHVVPPQQAGSGFLGGLEQGWRGLVHVLTQLSHGLGAALPTGVLLLLLLALGRLVVRRYGLGPFSPRRPAGSSEPAPPAA